MPLDLERYEEGAEPSLPRSPISALADDDVLSIVSVAPPHRLKMARVMSSPDGTLEHERFGNRLQLQG